MPINFKKWLFAFATTFAICAASLTILFRITNETQNRRADADVEATYSKSQDDLKYAEELEEPTPSDATNEILPNSVFGDNVFISIKDSDDETTSMEASDEPVQTEVDETALFEPNFEDEQTTSRGAGFDFSRMRQFDELFGEIDSSVESAHDEMQDATPNDDEELFVDDSGLNIDLDVEESALSEASDAADRPAAVANEDDQSSIEATSEVDGSNAAEPSVDELVEVESAAPEIESTPSVAATHGVILASKDVFDAEGRALYSEGLGDDFIFEPQTEFENDAQDNVAADVEADNLSETNQVAEDVDEILFDSNDAPADVERDANAADMNPEVGDSTAEETTEIVPNESDEPAIDLRDALNVDEIADADDFVFESNDATTDEESVDSVDDSDAQNGVEESVGESVVDSSEETTEVDEFDSEEAVADGSEAPESDAILAEPEDDILFDAAESAVKEEATEAHELDETDEIAFDSNEVPVDAAAPEIEESISESADADSTDKIDFDSNEVPVDAAAPEIEEAITESADAETTDEIDFDSNEVPVDTAAPEIEEAITESADAETTDEIAFDSNEVPVDAAAPEIEEPISESADAETTDEIDFDSNEVSVEAAAPEIEEAITESADAETSDEIDFDSNEVPVEAAAPEIEEAITESADAETTDEIAFDSNEVPVDAAAPEIEEAITESADVETSDEIVFDPNEVPVDTAAPEIEEPISESADAETTDEIVFDSNEVPAENAAPEIEEPISESADVETTDEIVFDSNEVPAENAAPEIEKPNTKDDDDEIIFDSNESFDDDEIIFDSNASDADDASEEENDSVPFDVESEHESLGVLLYDSAFSEFKTYERVETREAYEAQIDDVKADAREASATANAPVLLYDSSERGEFENGDAEKEADARQSTEEFLKALEDCAAGSALKTSETVGRVAERFEEEDPESTEVEASEERKEEEVVDDDADELAETTNESDPSTAAKQAESQAAVEFFNAPENKSTPSRDAQALSVARANVEVEDEFWVALANPGSTMLWRYDAGRWIQESEDVFFGTDDESRVTVFWAHGYQTDMTAATRGGAYLKSTLDRARRAIGVDRKFRVVVWKWASERFTMRIKRDAETKRILTNYYGAELGEFVGRLKPGDDVTFVGFSFGASVVGAALQTLATRPNRYLSSRMEEAFAVSGVNAPASPLRKEGRISLILASAGCDAYAFGRGGAFEMGGQLPTTVLNVYNPRDFVLKFYPAVAGGAQALGIAPVANEAFPNAGGRVYNLDVQTVLNREHSFEDALGAVPINYTATLVW